MPAEILLCIPGPWTERGDFFRHVLMHETPGRYMYAGGIFADVQAKDHVMLEFCDAYPQMREAFEAGGHGRLSDELLQQIEAHRSVLYLHFPADAVDQRERILKYTQIFQRLGGIALKVESAGITHSWERWFELMSSHTFDQYTALCTLIGGQSCYHSFGMHHFGRPDCEVPASIEIGEAADLMNQFNMYQIVENPELTSGHTFSVDESAPIYRLSHQADERYEADDPFHNPNGIWRLDPK